MTLRRRFQLSLRTAIVLMLIAGAFVGANVIPRKGADAKGWAAPILLDDESDAPQWTRRGWPFDFRQTLQLRSPWTGYRYAENWWALVWNAVCMVLTLVGVWAVLERPWRRSNPNPQTNE